MNTRTIYFLLSQLTPNTADSENYTVWCEIMRVMHLEQNVYGQQPQPHLKELHIQDGFLFLRSELVLYGIKLHPYASYFRRPFTKKSVATLTGVIV